MAVKLKLVGGTAISGVARGKELPLADWARLELATLATIEEAARQYIDVPDEFPHAFVPPQLRGVYSAVEVEIAHWKLTQHDRSTALRYYWLGLIMATVTLHPPWWSALNKILIKLTREEKQNGRRDDDTKRHGRRTRAARRPGRRARSARRPDAS